MSEQDNRKLWRKWDHQDSVRDQDINDFRSSQSANFGSLEDESEDAEERERVFFDLSTGIDNEYLKALLQSILAMSEVNMEDGLVGMAAKINSQNDFESEWEEPLKDIFPNGVNRTRLKVRVGRPYVSHEKKTLRLKVFLTYKGETKNIIFEGKEEDFAKYSGEDLRKEQPSQ